MHAQLVDGELDLALGIFPEPPEEVQIEELFADQFVCVADQSAASGRDTNARGMDAAATCDACTSA